MLYTTLNKICENKYPEDKRSKLAIKAVDKFINGEINKEELKNAVNTTWAFAAVNAAAALLLLLLLC